MKEGNTRKDALLLTMGLLLIFTGCSGPKTVTQQATTLVEARRGFKTVTVNRGVRREPVEKAPPAIFRTVEYPSANGPLKAYLTPNPGDHKKHPAIIWITGGDCNSIGDVWSPASREDDQTAAAYRKAGIVMMFPSLRGGNTNPGVKEGFLGEVDDIIVAAAFLAKLPYVDPKRIYLGGHSTGGTLALLVSECTNRFRAVFAFGPVDDVLRYAGYPEFLPFDTANNQEVMLRSPGYWLNSVQSPVWVIEGTGGNIEALRAMAKSSANPKAHFIEINGADHFATLAPTNELIARKIQRDTGDASKLAITQEEVNSNFSR